jgi:hypothetical protein
MTKDAASNLVNRLSNAQPNDSDDEYDGPTTAAEALCYEDNIEILKKENLPTNTKPHLPSWLKFIMALEVMTLGSDRMVVNTFASVFVSLQATATAVDDHRYDSDSFLIAIDNCSSRCITNSLDDYIGQPTKVNVRVSGIGGAVTANYKGTVKWSIEDDDGRVHT